MRDDGGTEGLELHKVLGEEQIEGPVKRYPQFLFKAWEFAEIYGPPQPPGNESGKADAQDVGNSGAAADGGELADGGKGKRFLASAAHRRRQVVCQGLAFPQG